MTRSSAGCNIEMQRSNVVQFHALDCIELHWSVQIIELHYTATNCIELHWIELHWITLERTNDWITLDWIALNYMGVCKLLNYITLHWITLHCITRSSAECNIETAVKQLNAVSLTSAAWLHLELLPQDQLSCTSSLICLKPFLSDWSKSLTFHCSIQI